MSWGAVAASLSHSEVPASDRPAVGRTRCFLTKSPQAQGSFPVRGLCGSLLALGGQAVARLQGGRGGRSPYSGLGKAPLFLTLDSHTVLRVSPMSVHGQRKAMTRWPACFEQGQGCKRSAGAKQGMGMLDWRFPKHCCWGWAYGIPGAGLSWGEARGGREGNTWGPSSSPPCKNKEGSWSVNSILGFAGKLEGTRILRGAVRGGGRVREMQTRLWEVKLWFSCPVVFICPRGRAAQNFSNLWSRVVLCSEKSILVLLAMLLVIYSHSRTYIKNTESVNPTPAYILDLGV